MTFCNSGANRHFFTTMLSYILHSCTSYTWWGYVFQWYETIDVAHLPPLEACCADCTTWRLLGDPSVTMQLSLARTSLTHSRGRGYTIHISWNCYGCQEIWDLLPPIACLFTACQGIALTTGTRMALIRLWRGVFNFNISCSALVLLFRCSLKKNATRLCWTFTVNHYKWMWILYLVAFYIHRLATSSE